LAWRNAGRWRRLANQRFRTRIALVGERKVPFRPDSSLGLCRRHVDHIRKKTPLHDEVIKPFLVDKTNLDKAGRIGEAK
jgi:hypothetical protein